MRASVFAFVSRSLLSVDTTLFSVNGALLSVYRALLSVYRALLPPRCQMHGSMFVYVSLSFGGWVAHGVGVCLCLCVYQCACVCAWDVYIRTH